MTVLEQKLARLLNNLLLRLSRNVELNQRRVKLNAQQACTLAVIVSDKVCIVTIIASDLSGVIILIDIILLIK